MKRYYNRDMAYVTAQPRIREDILSSLLENNASAVAAQTEWETEWNAVGLSSRLTEDEYRARKKQKLNKKLADQFRTSLQQGRTTSASLGLGSDLDTILSSFAGTNRHMHTSINLAGTVQTKALTTRGLVVGSNMLRSSSLLRKMTVH